MSPFHCLAVLSLFCLSVSSFSQEERLTTSSHVTQCVVAIPPQSDFVRRIGGDRVRVETLVSPGQSPHTYEPTPRQMVRLGKARLYFQIGLPFENALVEKIRANFETLKIVDTRQGVAMREMEACEGHGEHGKNADAHDHSAGEMDPHIWLDPLRVKTQARTIAAALAEEDPGNAEFYLSRCRNFEAELAAAHERIQEKLASLPSRRILVFHPAFGYFAESFQLEQVAVEIEGKEPTARQLTRLIARAKEERVRVIFVQPQFPIRSAQAVAEAIGGVVVPLDPLAENYLENLGVIAERVANAEW